MTAGPAGQRTDGNEESRPSIDPDARRVRVATRTRIPIYGADPELARLGTKSGGRGVFASAGVTYPIGAENLRSLDDLLQALGEMRAQKPDLTRAIVKLNDALSGEGNAVVDLRELPPPGAADERLRVGERLDRMVLEAPGVGVDAYLDALASRGGVVEERLVGPDLRSPSVQLAITPGRFHGVISTHTPTGSRSVTSRPGGTIGIVSPKILLAAPPQYSKTLATMSPPPPEKGFA